MTPLLGGLFVFAMRVTDMSLDTLRLLFMMRGRRLLAGMIGAIQATVFILAVSQVLAGPLNFWNVAGYSLGFATGVMLGMVAEERLALGYAMLRIYSPAQGSAIAQAIREAGYAATEFTAHGRDGAVTVVLCTVLRRQTGVIQAVVDRTDPHAFVTVEEVRPLQRGHFRH